MRTPLATPITVPSFSEGLEYMRRKNRRWTYLVLRDVKIHFPPATHLLPRMTGLQLMSDGQEYGRVLPHGIIVRAGYAWNGNSCWFDTKSTMLASLVHDLLFQFSGCCEWPEHLTNEWADALYYELARGPWRYVNSLGLGLFSSCFWGRITPVETQVEMFSMIEAT